MKIIAIIASVLNAGACIMCVVAAFRCMDIWYLVLILSLAAGANIVCLIRNVRFFMEE